MAIGGSGTQADPWTIGSSADLVAFSQSTSYWGSGTYAKLIADIPMNGVTGFSPIGTERYEYRGNFDGQGHVISNLTINKPSTSYVGLFSYAHGGTIQNIGCTRFDIKGFSIVGCLVGHINTGNLITNCYSSNNTVSGNYNVSGLIGAAGSTSTISNCYAYDNTISGNGYVSGLVGTANSPSTISNCAVYGGTHGNILIGTGSATATNCYTSSTVSSEVFHTRGFWDGTGVSGTTYLSWDFTTPVWHWSSSNSLPVLREPELPSINARKSGSWRKITTIYAKVSNNWRWVEKVYSNVGGSWKLCYANPVTPREITTYADLVTALTTRHPEPARLQCNLTATQEITVPKGYATSLDLNGYTIAGTGSFRFATVLGELYLHDSSSAGTGQITGFGASTNGGCIAIGTGGSNGLLVMDGGTISGCSTVQSGGGVHLWGGAFTMNGGTITGCSATIYGGGVFSNNGKFTMTAGTITGCSSAKANGGGGFRRQYGTFTWTGGTIVNNTPNNTYPAVTPPTGV